MLSDEEKKAIKILKVNPEIIADLDEEMFEKMCEFKEKSIKELKYWASQTALNLIEKQSKEIEELDKENTRQHELICNIHQKWEDKIKAKIEEVDENGYWEFLEKRDEEKCKNILQSLLEKE